MQSSRTATAILIVVTLLVVTSLSLSVRGFTGTPGVDAFSSDSWTKYGPLELSPERGRYALTYSIVEDHSLKFSLPIARMVVPDLAINSEGEYVSLFAPAVSFLAVPGYLLGKVLGVAQVGTYMVIVLFAVLNFLFIWSIAERLGAESWAALAGALTFSLATPAFPYAGTLYQHHISVFLLLLVIWVLLRFQSMWGFVVVWFACALSVVIDNPNLFLMFPVGLFALGRLFQSMNLKLGTSLSWKKIAFGLATFLALVPPVAFFLWYNLSAYGNPFQLPGTLQSVHEIGSDGQPATVNLYEIAALSPEQRTSLSLESGNEKTAISFFDTRNTYKGFFIHFLSLDRGILIFTPVVLLGIFGLTFLYRRKQRITSLLIATIGVNVLLYSMWGDPWGGWAFGSRYLIPTYALLAIGLALALSNWGKRAWFLILFLLLFTYSAWVNSLGAVTSLANPPEMQVLALEKQSNHEEKYTFLRNWEFLNGKYAPAIGSKSFVYQTWGKGHILAVTYHRIVFGFGILALALVLVLAYFSRNTILRS